VTPERKRKPDQTYNKWYIKPSVRMKQVQSSKIIDKSDTTYVYKQLYRDKYVDPDNPFEEKKS